MNSEKPTDLVMWWPSPEAFNDLTVIDIEEGWQLSAPDNTELADWLNYWNQSEEYRNFFNDSFIKALTNHAEFTLEQHGKTKAIPDQQSGDRTEA